MRSKSVETYLLDIRHNIVLANQFVAGFDYLTFRDDARTHYAVTRCLEIISEASRRLPDNLKARHPAIPWRQMAGAGNVYRHDYEDVSQHDVWIAVTRDLPPLLAAVEQELEDSCDHET
jgi:uncharacterized protein with HEPN domain